MYALDFEYDGQHLSDYGFIICDFSSSSGANVADAGSKITFKTVPHNHGKRYGLTGTQYDECIQTTFGICKNPDIFDDLSITGDEFRDIMRWLNRHEYLEFQVVYDEYITADPCLFEGSFNIKKVTIGDVLYGLELTLETNRPFGYGSEQVVKYNFEDTSAKFKLRDLSDDVGFTYPKVVVICNENGDLQINNAMTGCNTIVHNCVKGEVITIDGANHIISSSNDNHDVYDDFNYDYFTIGNTLNDRSNYISSSILCSIEIRYRPIIKDCP